MTGNKQPVIGVTMCLDEAGLIHQGINYSYIRREYGRELRAAGAQPIFLDASIDPHVAAELCDGIVISGGEDIHPSFYGRELQTQNALEPAARTWWERELIEACDVRGVRILGVCYGSQLLNVHYGGTLQQDIRLNPSSTTNHGSSSKAAIQPVTFSQSFLGFERGQAVLTAHRHHQAVDKLAKGFRAIARAEDGIIEAIAGHGHYGVQWHAESDDTAQTIYRSFVTICTAATPRVNNLVASE